MSSRRPALFVVLAAVTASAVIAACSDVSSPRVSRAEVVAAGPVSLISTCRDGTPPPPPSDTSSSFSYGDGGSDVSMLDAAPRLLPAAMSAAGYLLKTSSTGGTLSVQTTYMLNDGNGNGFISFDKVPSMISANARIYIRDCVPTGGQGTLSIPRLDGTTIRINLAQLGADQLQCAKVDTELGVDCSQLTITGGRLYDAKLGDVGAAPAVRFQLGVYCTPAMQDAGICISPAKDPTVIG